MYVKSRMLIGSITLTVIRVFKRINKVADLMLVKGQLSTELLAANNAKEKEKENETIRQIRLFRNIARFMAIRRVGRSKRTKERRHQ